MTPAWHTFLSLDAPAILTGLCAAISCGILGNFLVLRRTSLLGDAISHAVLPGLVAAFLIAGTRDAWPMFIGAAVAGVIAAVLIDWVRKYGKVESGAAMGVVFSIMFALGVLLIERAAARHVDLDPDCVLYGMLETVFWTPPNDLAEMLTWSSLSQLPRQVWVTGAMAIAAIHFVLIFYKELRISSFDPGLAAALGFPVGFINLLLTALIAAATVASFEAVGSILVIAMLICPAAAARLLTDRLRTQLILSTIIAGVCAVGGYTLGAFGPNWLGSEQSISTTGMMTVLNGLAVATAAIFAPAYGMLPRRFRQFKLAASMAREDLLGALYRLEESGSTPELSNTDPRTLTTSRLTRWYALRTAINRGEITRAHNTIAFTDKGRDAARQIVRSHRLWESFLVDVAGLRADHVHDTATRLEHLTNPDTLRNLATRQQGRTHDPHDKPIPPQTP